MTSIQHLIQTRNVLHLNAIVLYELNLNLR
jgi:hypothetical protein